MFYRQLFRDCPVIIDNKLVYWDKHLHADMEVKLPEPHEAPPNKWLMHDGHEECPLAVKYRALIIWMMKSQFPFISFQPGRVDWKYVDKYMILDGRSF